MIHIHSGIVLSHKEECNLTICDSIDGPTVYYANWNMSVTERQIPRDFTYMWDLKNKINN